MANLIQNNFISGEISPSLHGRSDLKAYYSAAAKIENFIVGKEGILRKRRGFRAFSVLNTFTSQNARMFPYFYDKDDGGIVVIWKRPEIGTYMYLYKKADLTNPAIQTVSEAASARLSTAVLSDEEMKELQCALIGDTFFVTARNKFFVKALVTFRKTGTSTITVTDYVADSKPPAVAAMSYNPVYFWDDSESAPTPHIKKVEYAAWIVRNGVLSDKRRLSCIWLSNWTAGSYIEIFVTPGTTDFDYVVLGKGSGGLWGEVARWYPEDITSKGGVTEETKTVSKDATSITTTATCKDLISCYVEDLGYDIGTECTVSGNTITLPTLPQPSDPDQENRTYKVKYYSTESTTTASWRDENYTPGEAIFPQTDTLSGMANPTCCNCFQQRLVLANFPGFPMTFAFSEIGNLYNFWADRPAKDDDPFSPTLASTGPAFVRWLIPYQKSMLAFTDAGIYAIAGSSSEGFCARTCQMNKLSDVIASTSVRPLETDFGIIFVGSDNKTLYTMAYDITTDQTIPISQMNFVEHFGRLGRIVATAVQTYPYRVVWCVMSDGTLASLTYDKAQEVAAWSRHKVDGWVFYDAAGIGSVTADETTNDGRSYTDVVFMAHRNGSDEPKFVTFRQHQFADAGFDAAEMPVVATLTTLRAEAQDKTIAGLKKNVKDVIVRLHESGPLKVKPAGTNLVMQTLAKDATASSPFTGEAKAMPMGYVNADGQMTFVSDTATNCEITGIIHRIEING